MEQRVSLITLGVGDLGRSRAFYEGLGWHGQEVDETVFFAAGGPALVLWGRDKLAGDAGIVGDAAGAGGVVTKDPGETFYGGYAGFFRDPDGYVWEVAHNPGFGLGADGTLTLPDFGSAS
ncbi:MAG TPA: VOC family protein [Acidimicrobiales bacterium]|nr:VOC family protein [Acidimicrobiales bacterium]